MESEFFSVDQIHPFKSDFLLPEMTFGVQALLRVMIKFRRQIYVNSSEEFYRKIAK